MKIWKRLFNVGFLLPIPADTIVGMYHPWRDLFGDIPFKNSLITDPVRQLYPWRELAVGLLKHFQFPGWNPYSFSGVPLAGNFQSSAFYPLNIIYLVTNFSTGWSIQVIMQTVLGFLFMWLFLHSLGLKKTAVMLGCLAWIGSGFFVAWWEWNTMIQTAIWLPLILFCINTNRKIVLTFSLICSFLAGGLQIFFYIFCLAFLYAFVKKRTIVFALCTLIGVVFTIFQWWPTLQFISESARNIDRAQWLRPDWFIPFKHIIMLIAPDYFGNPATLNYFGVWNYGEFVSYVGIIPLFFALFAGVFNRRRIGFFFVTVLLISLTFALPTFFAQIPFLLKIPLLSTAQPSRLIVLIDFSLAVLAALGLDSFLKKPNKKIILLLWIFLACLWFGAIYSGSKVSLNNLVFPTTILSLLTIFLNLKFALILILITVIDLGRFFFKFESFSKPEYIFPQTKVISFLQEKSKSEVFRIASLDDRIMPPNFSVHYKLQDIGGYDPLYLSRYGNYISKIEGGGGAFNRIITPKNYTHPLFDLLNVKYLLSFETISDPKYKLVLTEGQTKIYENLNVKPRTFFEGSSGTTKIDSYSENEIVITTDGLKTGKLILTDVYYPTWKATIDGKPATIIPYIDVFRSLDIPPGKHIVRFYYAI